MTDFDPRTITPPVRAKLIELCSTAITHNADAKRNDKPYFFVNFGNAIATVAAYANNERIYSSECIYLYSNSSRTEEDILENIAAVIDDINKLQKTWEGFAQGGAHA